MRRFRLLIIPAVILVGSLLFWAARRPLTETAVAQWFASQGVDARYRITAISPGAVTLNDVSLGPASSPEFTAARIDATIGWSPLRPRIASVRLVAPTLRATVTRDGIKFGSLDRLLPESSEPPARLPDIELTIVGGELRVATAAGVFAGTIEGSGRLGDSFRGRAAIAPARIASAGCSATLTDAALTFATKRDAVQVAAAGLLPRLACARGTAEAVGWSVAATLPPTLDRYSARIEARAARFASGTVGGRALVLRGTAAAPALTGQVTGTATAQASEIGGAGFRVRVVTASGPFRFDPASGQGAASAALSVTGGSMTLPNAPLRKVSRQLAGTLARPLLDALLARGDAAARDFDASAAVAARRDDSGTHLDLSGLVARAATGAVVRQSGRLKLDDDRITLAGGIAVTGGGLPSVTASGDGSARGSGIAGRILLTAAPWAVRGAAVEELRLEARSAAARTAVTGLVRASGAIGGGVIVRRLGIPVDVTIDPGGAITIGGQCMAIDWAGLARDTLAFGPGKARICPAGKAIARVAGGRLNGQGIVAPLQLRGQSAGTRFTARTSALNLTLSGPAARPRLALAPARVEASYADTRVAVRLGGDFGLSDASGTGSLADLRVDAPGLPVTVAGGSGRWRLAGGDIALSGGTARVADRTAPARFQPLRIESVAATLSNGLVAATGSGSLAATGARLFRFSASHTVASGRGVAEVETGQLGFGPGLQPYQITEALRGVIDNVTGPVIGKGRLAWTGDVVTSTGSLVIDHLSLATAALGPVDDIAGTLAFDDLLALTTQPGQMLTIKRINPGVAVDDGVVRFRLLGPDAAAIDSIVWPYAGGTLTLAPVTIRAGDVVRSFLLTVDSLDAELFLQKFEIKNLNVTGRFDGRLPLVFADGKGRIEGGTLVARPGGGLVQYVGAVGGEDLGAGARLAFDALRRLRYRSLALELDGDLDGELVTQLRFTGNNEAATTLAGGPLPIRATGLPFRFNVTVRAPFRSLLGTAASFSDVRPLIRPGAAGVQPR